MNDNTDLSCKARDQSPGMEKQKARLKIIICGGGLAGLASALLLREDHDVTILESSTLNEELGAAITLSMNASRLLRSSLARAGFDKDKAKYVEAEKVGTVLLLGTMSLMLKQKATRGALARPVDPPRVTNGAYHQDIRRALVVFLA